MYTLIGLVFLSISRLACGNSTEDLLDKSILRYGFQYTQDCEDFAKAFICIRKCQDLNYDTAVSDKHCKCTCFMKQEIQKHKIKSNTTRHDWKSGAPTTKLPIWAQTTNTDDTDEPDDDDHDTSEGSNTVTDHNAITNHDVPGNDSSKTDHENLTPPTNGSEEHHNGTTENNEIATETNQASKENHETNSETNKAGTENQETITEANKASTENHENTPGTNEANTENHENTPETNEASTENHDNSPKTNVNINNATKSDNTDDKTTNHDTASS